MLHLDGLAVLDRPAVSRLLLPLTQGALLLRQSGLAGRYDTAILVVLQLLLRQATRRVVGKPVHDRGARTNRADVSSSCGNFVRHLYCSYKLLLDGGSYILVGQNHLVREDEVEHATEKCRHPVVQNNAPDLVVACKGG